jgi:hypothetical protein
MIKEYRKKLNDAMREAGNEATAQTMGLPPYWINQHGGFGDILATEINFRKAGATIGAVAPYAGACLIANYSSTGMPENYLKDLNTFINFAISSAAFTVTLLPVVLGKFGYNAGKALDNLMGDSSLNVNKCKFARRQENKLR